jgi:phage shock protein A
MGLFNTLSTLIKGKATEATHAIEDRNADTLLDQSLRDSNANLVALKKDVAGLQRIHNDLERQRDAAEKKMNDALAAAKSFYGRGDDESKAKAAQLLDEVEDVLSPDFENLKTAVVNSKTKLDRAIAAVRKKERDQKTKANRVQQAKVQRKMNEVDRSLATNAVAADSKSQRADALLSRLEKAGQEEADQIKAEEDLFGEGHSNSTESLIAEANKAERSSNLEDRFKRFE